MEKSNRAKLLDIERRILAADERLVAAQNAFEEAKRNGVSTPEMESTIQLTEETLTAMRTYRDLLLNAIRLAAAEIEADD